MLYRSFIAPLIVAAALASCSSDSSPGASAGAAGAPPDASAEGAAGDASADTHTTDTSTGGAAGKDSGSPEDALAQDGSDDVAQDAQGEETEPPYDAASGPACVADPPPGSPEPLPWPTYAGTCPTFAQAPNMTSIDSSGSGRKFMVVAPANPGNERLPVVFVWHWLAGSPEDAYNELSLAAATEAMRFIAVVPASKGDSLLQWPFSLLDTQDRLDEEIQFFDDMLACVVEAYPNAARRCVASLGVSAGALFTDQLAARRADRLASFVSLSGGVGTTARPWDKPARKLPGIVLWGGPNDDYQGLYDFNKGSLALEDALVGEGNFFIECIHNCGHAVPPFDPPAVGTRFDLLWQFIFDHPFWITPGQSPYKGGLPATFPTWCGPGKGGAVPRPDGSPC